MISVLVLLAALCLATAVAEEHHDHNRHHGHHGSDSGSRDHDGHNGEHQQLDADEALREANRLISQARILKEQGKLTVDNELIGDGNILAAVQGGNDDDDDNNDNRRHGRHNNNNNDDDDDSRKSRHKGGRDHSDDDDDAANGSGDSSSTQLSTSDRLHIAVEERLIEAAIQQALNPAPTQTVVNKKAYQARYEITAFDGNAIQTHELNFGPTIISTRRNFFLTNSDAAQWWTMGDFLDANQDAEPDIIAALRTFRDSDNPLPYLTILRNRASGSRVRLDSRDTDGGLHTATIDLINLIRLDGKFSQTNQLLSPCFSATDEPAFVFETLVGLAPSEFNTNNPPNNQLNNPFQNATLSAAPEQRSQVLLAGSTALDPKNELTFNTVDQNLFYDSDSSQFVETFSIPLWLNLVPNQLIPGADNVVQQGTVYFTECAQFTYFK